MSTIIQNGFWILEHLSNIELYYSDPKNFGNRTVEITGDEFKHAFRVMRHKRDDELFITNGIGDIFKTRIDKVEKERIICVIIENRKYKNLLKNISFVLPALRNTSRFEIALEKSVELGITKFIVYQADRSQAKGKKIDRWNKILLAALKQSLHSFLPQLESVASLKALVPGENILIGFEQSSPNKFSEFQFNKEKKYFFIFGPEGGLSPDEQNLIDKNNIFNISPNRLRTETAILKIASLLSDKIND
jgi:16S rRNA (uracil1498-N3)-methyltransferase